MRFVFLVKIRDADRTMEASGADDLTACIYVFQRSIYQALILKRLLRQDALVKHYVTKAVAHLVQQTANGLLWIRILIPNAHALPGYLVQE